MSESEDPIVRWVEETGAALAWPLDGETQDLQPLAGLDAAIAAADVVAIGETDHFVHEKSDFRLLFCRYLLERGCRVFAEELAWSDGRRVADYLRSADATALERLSLFGWKGDQRADRDDAPTGVLRASFEAYPSALIGAEQTRFYAGLRRAAGERRLGYFGLDIDGYSGGGYADIAARLAPFAGSPAVDSFLAALARVPGETAAAESARLAALAPAARGLEAAVGAVAADVAIDLGALAESFAYVDRTYGAADYEALRPGMAYREGCMKRRFAEARALTGAAPMALMGHAMHLAKDDRRLAATPGGVGPGGGRQPSLGHHIAQELGLKVASIWVIHGAGEDSQPFPDLPRRFAYPPHALNARLQRFQSPVLFPTAGAPSGLFDRPVGVGHMYNLVQPVTLAAQADAILYLPSVTPMRSARQA